MARPREFDEDKVLDQAMQVFWSKGFEGTSLDDLCDATGLARSSLYGTFGDKRGVYLRALDLYEENAAARIREAFSRPVPARQAVADFLGQLVDSIVAGPGRRGCFIGNCAAELTKTDRDAAAHVKRSLRRVELAFREGLDAARSRQDLPATIDTRAVARFLTAGIQGLRLVGKANPDREILGDVATTMLRCLDP